MSTEHIMEILLAEKMFINCSTSLSGQHTVNQSFFYIYIYIYIYIYTEFNVSCYRVSQPYFERDLSFVNNGFLLFLCTYRASCTVYYPDQPMHKTHTHTYIYIYTYIYILTYLLHGAESFLRS